MKNLILSAIALVALASCNKEGNNIEVINPNAPVEVQFSSAPLTRTNAAGDAWLVDDKIGIYMVTKDATDITSPLAENIAYKASTEAATSDFTLVDGQTGISYPTDGAFVDFYAYYPQNDDVVNGVYAISVATQTAPASIDLMTASIKGKNKTNEDVNFTFAHQLSKLSLTITSAVGDISSLDVKIKGHNTTANVDLKTNGISGEGGNTTDIAALKTSTSSTVSTFSAILIPTKEGVAGSTIEITLNDVTYIWDIAAIVFAQGDEYNYNITIEKKGLVVTGSSINNWGDGTGDGNVTLN